jgi:hypothetical protein
VRVHRDTEQQRIALEANPAARRVRRDFPAGTRVLGRGVFGTVRYHVPALTSLGGYLIVDWDNGTTGRVSTVGLTRVVLPLET